MPYDRDYGKPEGVADRLDEHAERLAKDKSTPWLGMGLYDDLRAAASVIRGKPQTFDYGRERQIEKPKLEFDL